MDNKLIIDATFDELVSSDKRQFVVIVDTNSGKEMVSYGTVSAYVRVGKEDWRVEMYFKTTDNAAQVRQITINGDGTYKINLMVRNRPIPSSYIVKSVGTVDQYTDEEKKKHDLMLDIDRRLGHMCDDYVYFSVPIRLELKSIGKTVYVEYFTKSYHNIDNIINYKTDRIRMSTLSIEDLMLVRDRVLCRR